MRLNFLCGAILRWYPKAVKHPNRGWPKALIKKAEQSHEGPSAEEERRWLKRAAEWRLDTPSAVLRAMSKVWRGYCNGQLTEHRYRLLFAGLKEIRKGREAEAARKTATDLGVPFVGLTLVGPGSAAQVGSQKRPGFHSGFQRPGDPTRME